MEFMIYKYAKSYIFCFASDEEVCVVEI